MRRDRIKRKAYSPIKGLQRNYNQLKVIRYLLKKEGLADELVQVYKLSLYFNFTRKTPFRA